MATIGDIAQKAEVAKSTVSLVLNNTGYVSKQTREKVMAAIQELNYVPNSLARNLSLQKSGIVGVMVPDIANPFFSEFIKYVENELHILGYKTLICNTSGNEERERDYISMLQRKFMDGLIVGQYELSSDHYTDLKCPIVSLDRKIGPDVPIIRSNHEMASHLIVEEILRNKCQKVLMFLGTTVQNNTSMKRHELIKENLEKQAVEVLTIETDTPYHLDQLIEDVLKKNDIDGAVGADLYIMECLKAVFRSGKKIPEEFCAIAYDGTFVTEVNTLPVTTIVQPIQELAKQAVSVLGRMMIGEWEDKHEIIIDVQLKHRDTTKK